MISYLLGILIIIFILLTLTKSTDTTREGFAHGSGGGSNSSSSSSSNPAHSMNGNSKQTNPLENTLPISQINNNSNPQNNNSNPQNNNLNPQNKNMDPQNNNLNPQNNNSNPQNNNLNPQNNNMGLQNNNMGLQNERHQKNQGTLQETPNSTMGEINRMRFQTPTRLEMELPYEQLPTPNPNPNPTYSYNAVESRTENNTNDTKNPNPNTNIKNIIKKSAELSFLALENKEPISAMKSSNYAIAYVSALQEIYSDEQIQSATSINLTQFKNELVKIQNTITTNIKNTCSPSNTDKQYLLKIIKNI